MNDVMTETLQVISFVVSIITGSFTILVMVSDKFRKLILRTKEQKEKDAQREEEQRETDRCVLRELIETIYYKRRSSCELYQYEYESVALMYKQYKKLGGNSFVDKIWDIMQDWEVKP